MEEQETGKSERLDQYVVRQIPGLSRSAAAKLIEQGKVLVDSQPQTKAGYRVRSTNAVEISHDPTTEVVPDIELEVLYEDDDCVVIDKPAGVLVHSKGVFNPEATVATWLRNRVKGLEDERAGIVHRLDRATSGVMICAKTPQALSWLQKQFSQRKTKKRYEAVVAGTPDEPEAVIDMPIERNPKRPQTFRAGMNGKSATTHYKILTANDTCSLLELQPTTGRTHQLRVHLSHIGHPILGDELYGGPPAERLFLHAHSLELTLPNRQRKTFTIPTPTTFKKMAGV
ncbi:MAG TPA: RluA family pseudouridine synthase [Verrucomicrobiae bacterium]|nr:RluA family pseudouridine synthase [Verrucomicrobiae bacterium]